MATPTIKLSLSAKRNSVYNISGRTRNKTTGNLSSGLAYWQFCKENLQKTFLKCQTNLSPVRSATLLLSPPTRPLGRDDKPIIHRKQP